MPSMVMIFAPLAYLVTGIMQALIGLSSISTVQAPHWPSSQQTLQPVSSSLLAQHVGQRLGASATTRPVDAVDVQ